MAGYRAFYVGPEGKFQESVSFDSASDKAAIVQAKQLAEHRAIELWSGPRLIAAYGKSSTPA